jgi:uncharacterized protein with ParB-like and HNH nuclease domain
MPEQAGELFDDLITFMQANTGDVAEMPPYFLGSIVLIKTESAPEADVVDGQQRLTTLTLLLAAIRATVAKESGEYITPLLYERGNPIRGTRERFRLSLRDRDAEFFQQYVQREGAFDDLLALKSELPDSQRNIQANGKLFVEKLNPLDEAERLRLAQFAVTRCFLVAVATPDLDAAYRIFSVLNSRGLDLSATDILKAEIIGAIVDAKKLDYTKKWEDVEEDLGRDEFGELFSHIRMVYRKTKPKGTLLKEFKEHVTEARTPSIFIDQVLVPMSEAYEQIVDAAYASTELAEEVNESLKWLNKLEFTDWMPPSLAFFVKHREDPRSLNRFFQDLERLAYSMLVRRVGINERIERFSALTVAIETSSDLYRPDSPLQFSAQEQIDTHTRLDGPVYEDLAARSRTTILLRLDALLAGGGATYDHASVTVEHVLPQNPPASSEWLRWFPNEGERVESVNKLGNLALLTRKKNSSASNFDFAKKKDSYFTKGGVSPFAITTQVLQHAEWLPRIVRSRQQQLLGVLDNHWRLIERPAAGSRPELK